MSDIELVKIFSDTSERSSVKDLNLKNVKNIVYERENPSPFLITILVLVVVLIIYLLYLLFIKECISGTWYGNSRLIPSIIKYRIYHNRFNNNIDIKWDGGETYGRLIGLTIVLSKPIGSNRVGVLVEKNKIKWLDSTDIWNNVLTLR
jgi:hypothetical protein